MDKQENKVSELTVGTIIGDRIVTRQISETEAYCRPLTLLEKSILFDPDWRDWLNKAGIFRDEYYTMVEWGKPSERLGSCLVKKEKHD